MFEGLDERLAEAVLLKPRFCPLRCGAEVPGKLYEYHLAEECPNRQAVCPEGCGDRMLGSLMAAHRVVCPMGVFLSRAEAAIRESSMREFRLAYDGAYAERERARVRMRARGEEDFRRTWWPSQRARIRMEAIEAESRQLVQRSRRRAVEHLTAAIASSSADGGAAATEEKGPVNALKYWDSFYAGEGGGADRASRPWDLETPSLQQLLDALEEAAIAGADVALRRRGEARLLNLLRRIIDCATSTADDKQRVLTDALAKVREAMPRIELEDPGDLIPSIQHAMVEAQKATLQELTASAPEFFKALAEGDVDLCRWLLERERANPSLPDPRSGLPPLVVAAKHGDVPMCRLLVEWKAQVDERCAIDGSSALHWAAHSRNFPVMSVLLGLKANPRLQDKRGLDALMKLVRREFRKPADGCTVGWEVQHGRRLTGPRLPSSGVMDLDSAQVAAEADPDCVGFSFRETMDAMSTRRFTVLRGVGSAQPPPPAAAPDEAGDEGLATLSEAELLDMQEEAEDESLWVTHLKVPCDPIHDLRALLTAGADATAADRSGLTALHHHLRSCPKRGDVAAVAELLRGGADVNVLDRTDRAASPLAIAVSAKRADLVQLMLTEAFPPANVDGAGEDGSSLLALAEASGAQEVANLLRDAGAVEWQRAEVRLGARTTFSFDNRSLPLFA